MTNTGNRQRVRKVPLIAALVTLFRAEGDPSMVWGGWACIVGASTFLWAILLHPSMKPSGSDPMPIPGYVAISVFLVIGLVQIGRVMRRGVITIWMLRKGTLVTGQLKKIEKTGASIGGVAEHRFTYSFRADDGKLYLTVARAISDAALGSGSGVRILYDLSKPSRSVVVDYLPSYLTIDADGHLVYRPSVVEMAQILLVPGIVLAINFYSLIRMLSGK